MLTIGTGVSVYPELDALADVRWADAQPEISAAWMLDHLQGWFPRGVPAGVVADPHRVLEPFSVLAAGAAVTNRVRLGVAVTDPVRRSSVALAHTASTIGSIGRREFVLGLGVGDPGQLQPFGLHGGRERTGRLDYMRPAVRDLHALRTSGALTQDGPSLGLAADAPLRLHIAAHGPKMLELTARYADGWLPTSLSPTEYGQRLATLREHAQRHGRDPRAIIPGLFLWAALAGSRTESQRLLAHPSVRAVALYRGQAGFATYGATYPLPHSYIPHDVPPDRAESLLRDIPDDVVRTAVLHGSPADVGQRLGAYRDAGCEHVIIYDIGRYVDAEGTARSREALLSAIGSSPAARV